MQTDQALKQVAGTKWLIEQHLTDEGDLSHAEEVWFFVRQFLSGYRIDFEERHFLGHYHAEADKRVLSGLYPLDFTELFWFCMWASTIIFTQPTLELSLDWSLKVAQYGKIDVELWKTLGSNFYQRVTEGA